MIITGRGKHSDEGVALLRPAVLEMLAQPEYAALGAAIDPGNEGCVRVSAARLVGWLSDERTDERTVPTDDGGDDTPEAATLTGDRGVIGGADDENAHFAALDGVKVAVLRERLREEGRAPLAMVRQADLPAETPASGAVKSAAVRLLLRLRPPACPSPSSRRSSRRGRTCSPG